MGVIEQYLEILEEHQKKYGNNVVVFMQIGDFYEIYGVELPDGTFKGTLRQVAELCNISVTRKSVCVFKNKENKAYMAGFPLYVIDKFTNIMVDTYGWQVVQIDQDSKEKNTTRSIVGVYSPGTNLSSQQDTNNLVSIYIEKTTSRRNKRLKGDNSTLICGMSCIDVLTGENCIYEHYSDSSDSAIAYDEIQKFISVKNPKELLINCEGLDIDSDDLYNLFNSKNRPCRINMEGVENRLKKIQYQQRLLAKVFMNNAECMI